MAGTSAPAVGPLYIVTERFAPDTKGAEWEHFRTWSGISQLTELVSLDSYLCPPVVREILPDDWDHVVTEDFMLDYFLDVDHLVARAGHLRGRNLLAVYRDPPTPPEGPPTDRYRFVFEGYDLVELGGGPSLLSDCGGFPQAFALEELTTHGLLPSLDRAREVLRALHQHYPNLEHLPRCEPWAIYRAASPPED
jgi:hypothetical protein